MSLACRRAAGRILLLAALVSLSSVGSPGLSAQPAQGSMAPTVPSDLDLRRYDFERFYPFQDFSSTTIRISLPGDWTGRPMPYVADPILHGANVASGASAKIISFENHPTSSELRIQVTGLSTAGDYDLPITLSPGQDAPQTVKLLIHASDGPLFPLLVICCGVAAGMGSQHLTRQRPLQKLRADIARARARVARLQTHMRAPLAELNDISVALSDIEIDSSYQEPGPLRTRLDDVVARLDRIDRDRTSEREKLRTFVTESMARLDDQPVRWIEPSAEDRRTIEELDTHLGKIRAAADADKLDDARDQARDWSNRFGSFITDRARRFVDEIEARAAKTDMTDADRARIHTAAGRVRELLAQSPREVVQQLNELNQRAVALEREASAKSVSLPTVEPKAGRRTAASVPSPSPSSTAEAEAAQIAAVRGVSRNEILFALLSAAVAIASGWLTIYTGKAFGGAADYITALVWGFGLNAATHTVRDVSKA